MNRLLFCTKKKWLPSETTSLRMVRRKGLEPPTYWFVASHSIQLSYRRISRIAPKYSITPSWKMQVLFSRFFDD